MSASDIPLPWERLLWSGRPAMSWTRRRQYILTDLRLASFERDSVVEIALYDIADIHRTESSFGRLAGLSTIVVQSRRTPRRLVLDRVRRGSHLAALLELLSGEPRTGLDPDAVKAALAWDPRGRRTGAREGLAAIALVVTAVIAALAGLRGGAPAVVSAADDPIHPGGQKRSRAEIIRFMEADVLPWARMALGPIAGGPDRVTCDTCHGRNADARGWQMPAVAALPEPDIRASGWERYGGPMDAQIRNAIYGYRAESDKQARAAYMREIVLPGMAALLHRPPYDFTKPYAYNRSRQAFGCYHCHQVT